MVIPLYEVGCIRVTHPSAGRHLLYCYSIAAPRLACVKPAASVHPEPGSNSSLYNSFNSLILNSVILPVNTPQYQPVHVRYLGFIFIKDLSSPQKKTLTPISPHPHQLWDCKSTHFLYSHQIFTEVFLHHKPQHIEYHQIYFILKYYNQP